MCGAEVRSRVDAAWAVLDGVPDPEVPAISLRELGIVPGRFAEVSFLGAGGELVLQVPVLDGTLAEYAELLGDDEG